MTECPAPNHSWTRTQNNKLSCYLCGALGIKLLQTRREHRPKPWEQSPSIVECAIITPIPYDDDTTSP